MNATPRAPSPALIRVLLIDGDPEDYRLLSDMLDAVPGTRFVIDRADSLASGRDRLDHSRFDVCLLALRLPDGDGMDLLATAEALLPAMPIIVLERAPTPEQDQRAMTLGAAALQDKDQLSPHTLERVIRYAISQRRKASDLARQTMRDQGTGLLSPLLYRDRLDRALAFARRRDREVAVMMIDIDVRCESGSLGVVERPLIDAVLAAAGQRLAAHLRETDSIARLSQKRLGLLIEGMGGLDHAAMVARRSLRLLRKPIDVRLPGEAGSRSVATVPSLGIAVYPLEAGDGDALLRQADAAMRRAMAEGGGCCRFSSARIDHEAREAMVLEKAFTTAVQRRELSLRFHPELCLRSRQPGLAGEVFWRHADRGWLPLVGVTAGTEDETLIKSIVDWGLAAAAEQLLIWRRDGLKRVPLSLSLPFRHGPTLSLMDQAVREQVRPRKVDPKRITLDLQQDLILEDARQGGADLTALAATGIGLVLDGFGKGRATVQDIRASLLRGLKLAAGLHQDVPADARNETLIGALIGFGHHLGLKVSAKGTFDQRQFSLLKHLGCDSVQLTATFPPMGASAAATWLRAATSTQDEVRHDRRTPEIFVPGERLQPRTGADTPSPLDET